MRVCRYCNQIIDLDTLNDLWRSREDGVISCNKNNNKSSYRWTHQPYVWKVKEKI